MRSVISFLFTGATPQNSIEWSLVFLFKILISYPSQLIDVFYFTTKTHPIFIEFASQELCDSCLLSVINFLLIGAIPQNSIEWSLVLLFKIIISYPSQLIGVYSFTTKTHPILKLLNHICPCGFIHISNQIIWLLSLHHRNYLTRVCKVFSFYCSEELLHRTVLCDH